MDDRPLLGTDASKCEAPALLAAARHGDPRAWSTLVARHGARIRAVARRHRLNHADQADVEQSTWLRLFENIESVREPWALAGWLSTTAHRECVRVLASSQREVALERTSEGHAEESSSHEQAVASERREALQHAVNRLGPSQRRLIGALLHEPALTYEGVGDLLGMPRGSIGPTRARCLARLRRDPQLADAIGAEFL